MRSFLILVLLSFSHQGVIAFAADTLKTPVIKVKKGITPFKEVAALPKVLREASGLEFTGKHFWSHNDDGIPALYCLDSTGVPCGAVQLNSVNRGWEDLALDQMGNIYIGGFGNNKNDKRDLKIYRIPNPDTISAALTTPEIIFFRYSDQSAYPPDKSKKNFDVDAFFEWDGALYLFTKGRSSPFRSISKIYQLSTEPGEQTAQLIDSLHTGGDVMINGWITSADLSPDQKTLALLFHDRIWLIRDFTKDRISRGKVYELSLNHYSHKAGLTFFNDTTIYIVDELEANILGGKMYKLDLSKWISEVAPGEN